MSIDNRNYSPHSAMPPPQALLQMMSSSWVSQALYVAAKLGIPDLLGKGPRTSEELAQAVEANPQSLYRLLRALSSVGVFSEGESGRFELTPLGAELQTGVPGAMHAITLLFGEPWIWGPCGNLLHSVKTGEVAFERLYGMDCFAYFEQSPDAGALFHRAMTAFTAQMHTAALDEYSFSPFNTVVDVGGGHGRFLSTILNEYPHLLGVLFDQPHVIAGAEPHITEAGVAERCQLVGGDFFAEVPDGGDAYILAHILHDWDDSRAVAILKNIHKVMPKQGRLVILEQVIPHGNEPHFGKWLDLVMLVMTGGRERTGRELRTLLDRAGFTLSQIIPTRSPLSVVEATRA